MRRTCASPNTIVNKHRSGTPGLREGQPIDLVRELGGQPGSQSAPIRTPPERISSCYIKALRSSELGSRFGAYSHPRRFCVPPGRVSQTNYALKQQKAYWNLHLDYQPGSRVFGWTLFPNKAGMKSDGNLVSGEGTASKAAKQICIVASGRGATIR
jgi:hypothetical protein